MPLRLAVAISRPQSSEISMSTSMARPPKRGIKSLTSHSSSKALFSPAARISMPRLISANEITEMKTSSSSRPRTQCNTRASGLGLMNSDTTFVSSRYIRDRYREARHETRSRSSPLPLKGEFIRNSASDPLRRVLRCHSSMPTTTATGFPFRVIVCGETEALSTTSEKRALASAAAQSDVTGFVFGASTSKLSPGCPLPQSGHRRM